MENWLPVIAAALASPVLVKLVEAIIAKLNKKETQLDRIEKELTTMKSTLVDVKIDQMRTNILLLLHAYPDHPDIPKLAEKYVTAYNGNSYVVPLLQAWYNEKQLATPQWLTEAIIKHGEQK